MPRGYLKRDTAAGVKSRRGGSSKKPQKGETPKRNSHKKSRATKVLDFDDDWSYDYEVDHRGILCESDDYWLPEKSDNKYEKKKAQPPEDIDECGICYDTKPVMHLAKSCKHAKACFDCFRQYYIVSAQKDIINYPLRCWHPACSFRKLPVDQIKQFARTSQELKRHYGMSTLARARTQGKIGAHCPNCNHPRAFRPNSSNSNNNSVRVFSCQECKKMVAVFMSQTDWNLHNFLLEVGEAQEKKCGRSPGLWELSKPMAATMDGRSVPIAT